MQTPSQVARRANVSSQTIRNYSRDYAELLSPSANGSDGPRLFTDDDVNTLCSIAALRKSGVPPGDVAERIRNGQMPPVIDVALNAPSNDVQEGQKTGQNDVFALQLVQSSLNDRLNAIERRLEGQDRNAIWWARGEGILIGMVAMMGLLVLAWLLVNGGAP